MRFEVQDFCPTTFVVDEEAVYVFDYDGVIIAPDENDSYEYEPTKNEESELAKLAGELDVAEGGLDTRYKRHLVYQEALMRTDASSTPGPAFFCFKQACYTGRAFILTARSGIAASERVRLFLRYNGLTGC